ncbi:MAG: hypothetical protein V1874_15535 [Spirochaetota bacterium]
MNKFLKLFAITLVTAFLFTACGGGSSSSGGGGEGTDPTAPPSTDALKINGDTSGKHEHQSVAFNSTGSTGLSVWHVYNGVYYEVLYSVYSGSSWSDELQLVLYGSNPSIATDGTNFMVVYNKSGNIYMRTYDGTDWSAESSIESESGYGYEPKIAARGTTGQYAVAWNQWNGSNYVLYANIYNGSAWGTASRIDNVANNISSFCIASNGTGYALAWNQYTGSRYNLYANVYNGTIWTGVADIDEVTDYSADLPAIASNGTTYAVIWYQRDASHYNSYVNIYNAGWGMATVISSGSSDSFNPDIASNGAGYAAVWSQWGGSSYSIFACFYNGSTWGTATDVGLATTYSSLPSIAQSGTSYAVTWYQEDSEAYNIYASIYNGSSWGASALLEHGSGRALYPLIVKKGSTDSFAAAWEQIDASGNSNIVTSIYSGTSWSSEKSLAVSLHKGLCDYYKLATNDAGKSLAVWQQYNSGSYCTYASVNITGTWETPVKLAGNAETYEYSYNPSLATNGTIFMVVYESNGDIHARSFDGSSWGTEVKLESTNYYSYEPSVASNGTGFAAVWHKYDPNIPSIYASIYNGTSWSAETLIESQADSSYSPVIASNGTGYAAVWSQYDGATYSLYANLCDGSSWGTESKLSTSTGYLYIPAVASNGTGYAVVWGQSDGLYNNAYANIYNGTAWSGANVIDTGDTYVDYSSSVAAYGAGYVTTWSQYSNINFNYNIYVKFYNGALWSAETEIDEGSPPSIASNTSGCGLVWYTYDGSYDSVYMSLFDGSSWASSVLLETIDGSAAYMPHITTNGNKYSAIWRQDGTLSRDIYAKLGL